MYSRLKLITLLILVCTLISCGSADIKVWSISPAEATHQAGTQDALTMNSLTGQATSQTYLNDLYGLTFMYPISWELHETSNMVSVEKDGVTLHISFKRTTDEDINILPSGMPAGDIVKGNPAEIYLLGMLTPKRMIQLDDVTQSIMYGNGPRQIANIELFIQADISDYQVATTGITTDLEAELDDIVKSVDLIWIAFPLMDEAMAEWNIYTNDDYDFSLRYPTSWELDETEFMNNIILRREGYHLVINFRLEDEEVQLIPSGTSAGEFQKGDPIFVFMEEQEVERVHLVYENQIKTVIYTGEDVITPLEFGDLELVAFLSDDAHDYLEVDLPRDIRDEADVMMASFIFEQEAAADE